MSVQVNLYLMLAAEIPSPKDEDWEKIEPFRESAYEGPKEFSIVDDSMSGKYCFAGRVLSKSKELNGDSPDLYGNVDFYEIPAITQIDKEMVAKDIKDKLGITVELHNVRPVMFFHYT